MNKSIQLTVDEGSTRRVHDPLNKSVYHLETYLPFSEAVRLARGNANVRPPKENQPFREMIKTVEESPESFHLKNRGITYICSKFNYDNQNKRLTIVIPNVPEARLEEEDVPRFGIADGGHTFAVVQEVIKNITKFKDENDDWVEPYVRVHFLGGDADEAGIEGIVEALNTSTQVKPFTLEEYRGRFDELKAALTDNKFDISQIAFRENEVKEWQVTEIIQRMACFLKDRWKITPPSSMYRSKEKALRLFVDDEKKGEFKKLYPIIKEVITFPEFIQSSLSEHLEGRRVGKVKGVRRVKRKPFKRACTDYSATYKMDTAIVLPMAAAFRTLLVQRGDSYRWKISPYEVFKHCAKDLYEVLLQRIKRYKSAGQLAADQEYWISCEKIVMSAREEIEDKRSNK